MTARPTTLSSKRKHVLHVTLPIHPAVDAPLTQVIGPSSIQLAGHFFGAGTKVCVDAWVVRRICGTDANDSKPERSFTEEERAIMDRNWLQFGAGHTGMLSARARVCWRCTLPFRRACRTSIWKGFEERASRNQALARRRCGSRRRIQTAL
ncbi:hypothetical protein BDU57DRAFT_576989 [Ampelomyces quisqualis]|uniref:Uncharacterized protein n=1 Tax=Ampelomyces quisqualis TaxID=50730 RepID=A0A6A5QJ21_AMPQU|nr:hypothetical protein BDU57DRAFT_576989 [Ampelomyces quisqualis]